MLTPGPIVALNFGVGQPFVVSRQTPCPVAASRVALFDAVDVIWNQQLVRQCVPAEM
jgi:hypothetical protein